jgi:hypothetical protein
MLVMLVMLVLSATLSVALPHFLLPFPPPLPGLPEVKCGRVHDLYETVVYDAMCIHSVDGLYKVGTQRLYTTAL